MSTIAPARGPRVPVYAVEPRKHFQGVFGGMFGPAARPAVFENLVRAGAVEQVRLPFHDTIRANLRPTRLVDELLTTGFELVETTKVLRVEPE
jgi:hypothetical protein